ncbi:MAG: hypothetical protein V4710_18705 [Verrucomicrobiota bacterium]
MKKVSLIIPILLVSGAIAAGLFYLKAKLGPHTPRGAELVPAETIFFAQLPDLARTRGRWLETSLVQLWKEPEMQAFLEKPLAKLAQDSRWQARMDNLRTLRPREMFIAVTSIEGAKPRFVMGIAFSGSKSRMEALLAEPRATLKTWWPAGKTDLINYGSSEIEIFSEKENAMAGGFRGDWYFAANNLELLERTIDRHDRKSSGESAAGTGRPDGNLADSSVFAAATSPLPADRDGLLFLQLGTVMDRVTALLTASGQTLNESQVAAMKKTQAVASSTRIEGKQFRDTLFVLSPGAASEGVLQRHSLALSSPGTLLYYAMGLPATVELPESFLSMATLWMPGLANMQKNLAEKGLSLSDLGKTFGPEFGTIVDWPSTAFQPSLLMALDVRDPLKAKAFTEMLSAGTEESGAWQRKEVDDAVIYSAPASESLVTPTIALTERFLLAGLTEQSVLPALEQLKGGGATLAVKPDFESAARALVPPTTSFGYMDLGGLFERAYGTFRPFVIMSMAFAPGVGEYVDAGKLPSTQVVARHLGSIALSQAASGNGTVFESAGTLTFTQLLVAGMAGSVAAALPNLNALSNGGVLPANSPFTLPGAFSPPAPQSQPVVPDATESAPEQ